MEVVHHLLPRLRANERVLRDAGLLVSTRYGRSVLYLRSELGTALLEARAG